MELVAVDYQAENAAELFTKSLRETGFGVLKNHPIEKSAVQSIYDNWQVFFDSDLKNEFLYNKDSQDGFFPSTVSEVAKGFTNKDIKEYFHFYPWGMCPADLRAEVDSYYKQANTLAKELLSWVEEYSPEDVAAKYRQPLSSMIDGSEQTLLRVLH